MEAPKEIYVDISHPISHEYTEMVAFETPDKDSVKYIRADLAELTWDTVQDIITIYDRLCSEYYSRLYKHRPDTKIFYKEVLRRFMDYKARKK